MNDLRVFVVCCCICILSVSSALSQRIIYDYDASGNQTSRTLSVQAVDAPIFDWQTASINNSSINSIKVYPNPVSTELNIEQSFDDTAVHVSDISLFSLSGVLLEQHKSESLFFTLDMTPYSEGIYVLIVKTSKGEYSWKIIKK